MGLSGRTDGDANFGWLPRSNDATRVRRILDEVQPEALVSFVVDDVRYMIRVEHAREIARRLRRMSVPILLSPAKAAAIRIELMIEEPAAAAEAPEWRGDEKDALRWAIEEWLGKVGLRGFPQEFVALRYALVAEARHADEDSLD